MTNFDWMDELTELELTNLVERSTHLVEHATHLLIERDKQTAKVYVETIRDCCFAIEKLHTDIPIPAPVPYYNWNELAIMFDSFLTNLE